MIEYLIQIFVPTTDHLHYRAPRLASFVDSDGNTVTTAGQPFSKEEREAVRALVATNWPQIAAVQGLKNASVRPGDTASLATIRVLPLYDAATAVSNTLVNMEDAALAVVPPVAIDGAMSFGYITAEQRQDALDRLAEIGLSKMAPSVRAAVPNVVNP